ncbi:MAG: cytochrome c peroxidase [Verrucomicrobiota bacterium]
MKPCFAPLFALTTSLVAQDGVLDLTQLENYANQTVPSYITATSRDNTPADNPITDLGATLGRVLFYDKRLSRNSTISCASCHQQENAFSDLDLQSTGVSGITGRHSMRLINSRFADEDNFFWDERANTLEDQTTQPIQDHIEMGFSGTLDDPDFSDLVTRLSAIDEYHVLFSAVFDDPTITETRIQDALAQFIRSIQSFDSKYDEGRSQVNNDNVDFPNFTASENNGKDLFLAPPGPGAGCAICHRPPTFDIDPNSGNNGVVGNLTGGTDTTVTRSPSLRDMVTSTGVPHGPFMHDGSLATLTDVINHYDDVTPVAGLDRRLAGGRGGNGQNLNLSAQEITDLVAFLETLTGSDVYTNPKWSDPFDPAGNLSLIILAENEMEIAHNLTQANISTFGVTGMTYTLEWADNLEFTNSTSASVTCNESGVLSHLVDVSGQQKLFFRYTYQP